MTDQSPLISGAERLRPPGVPYCGRFAPSPTGPLHLGSLVAALASWLDARAHGGRWLVRMEDVDQPRCVPGAAAQILSALQAHGLEWDGPVLVQSQRTDAYQAALAQLQAAGQVYPCSCSRRDIAQVARHGVEGWIYPGTCRSGMARTKAVPAWRLRSPSHEIGFTDRALGWQSQCVAEVVGDTVLKRADGWFAYHLAVVVDDAWQGVTDVVRGRDLLLSTPRHFWLQQCLGLPTLRYLHLPLVLNADGQKLSKQTCAAALDPQQALGNLQQAAGYLGLVIPEHVPTLGWWLESALHAWRAQWLPVDDGAG